MQLYFASFRGLAVYRYTDLFSFINFSGSVYVNLE